MADYEWELKVKMEHCLCRFPPLPLLHARRRISGHKIRYGVNDRENNSPQKTFSDFTEATARLQSFLDRISLSCILFPTEGLRKKRNQPPPRRRRRRLLLGRLWKKGGIFIFSFIFTCERGRNNQRLIERDYQYIIHFYIYIFFTFCTLEEPQKNL